MIDSHSNSSAKGISSVFLLFVVTIPLLVLLPLGLSFAEHSLFGTNYVEDLCRQIHLHDFLSKIYRPIFDAVEHLTRMIP